MGVRACRLYTLIRCIGFQGQDTEPLDHVAESLLIWRYSMPQIAIAERKYIASGPSTSHKRLPSYVYRDVAGKT